MSNNCDYDDNNNNNNNDDDNDNNINCTTFTSIRSLNATWNLVHRCSERYFNLEIMRHVLLFGSNVLYKLAGSQPFDFEQLVDSAPSCYTFS